MRLKSDPAYSCLQAGGVPLLHRHSAAANSVVGASRTETGPRSAALLLMPMAMCPLYVWRAIRRCGRIVRIYLAKAAIASDHVGPAGFDRSIFAIPFDVAGANVHDCAPGCIADIGGMTGQNRKTQRYRGGGGGQNRMRFIVIPPYHSLRYKLLAAALVAVNYRASTWISRFHRKSRI